MDIKIVFLYRDIKKHIWIKLLTGCSVISTAKLNKTLYNLK
jgi:hypothetical protein